MHRNARGPRWPTAALWIVLVIPGSAAPAGPPPGYASDIQIDHDAVGCVVAGRHPRLDACFEPDSAVGRAQVHFRASDSDPWYAVELRPDGPCHSALLPEPLHTTTEIQYYVDVLDRWFNESQAPPTAPQDAYRVKVVPPDETCSRGRLAWAATMPAGPIVVAVAKDATGKVLDAAMVKAMEGEMVLSGFSPGNVIVSTTGLGAGEASVANVPGSSTTGASAGSSSTGAAAGGGGLSGAAIAGIVAGGLVVAGAGVYAATHASTGACESTARLTCSPFVCGTTVCVDTRSDCSVCAYFTGPDGRRFECGGGCPMTVISVDSCVNEWASAFQARYSRYCR